MTVAEILKEAKALISTRERFAQMAFAYSEAGAGVDPNDTRASRWCAVGAVMRVSGAQPLLLSLPFEVDRALYLLANEADPYVAQEDALDTFIMTIACVNDHAGVKDDRPDLAFKAIHNLYDAAIKRAEEAA